LIVIRVRGQRVGSTRVFEEACVVDTRLSLHEPAGAAPEAPVSAVSWAAVIAGATVAAALMVMLIALGAGLGLGSVSPWSNSGVSPTTFGILAAAWLIAIQLFAYGVGGFIAGRMRTQWVGVHTDEVFFRDTAHGFLVWALGALLGVAVLASAVGTAASGVGQVASSLAGGASAAIGTAATAAGGAAAQASGSDQNAAASYFTDTLFRSDKPASDPAAATAEAGRILSRSLVNGSLSPEDKSYLARLIAARTGLSQPDAEKRVDDVVAQAKAAAQSAADKAKQAVDTARKAGIAIALWVFVSLLVGAFSACYLATVGGRLRDDLPATG
jgi:hypothetical protein